MTRNVSPRGRVTYFSWSDPHAVYRIYNHSGHLIYIGTSYDPVARIVAHRAEKPWRAEIATHTEEWHTNRQKALAAEHAAIAAEDPDYNVVGTPLGREVSLAFMGPDTAEDNKQTRMATAHRARVAARLGKDAR